MYEKSAEVRSWSPLFNAALLLWQNTWFVREVVCMVYGALVWHNYNYNYICVVCCSLSGDLSHDSWWHWRSYAASAGSGRHWSPQLGLKGQVAWEKLFEGWCPETPSRLLFSQQVCVCACSHDYNVLKSTEILTDCCILVVSPSANIQEVPQVCASAHVGTACVLFFLSHTHSANAVAGTQGTHKGASALQHGVDAKLRGVELIPDGLADRWHVWRQHHWQQAGDVHRHTGHCARALPEEEKHRSVSQTDHQSKCSS